MLSVLSPIFATAALEQRGNVPYMNACNTVGLDRGGRGAEVKGSKRMWRAGLAALFILMTIDVAREAQFWGSPYGRGGYSLHVSSRALLGISLGRRVSDCAAAAPRLRSGGPRPEVDRTSSRATSFPSAIPSAASSSTPRAASCSWSSRPPRRCTIRSPSAARASRGPARKPSAARPNGRTGIRRRRCAGAIPRLPEKMTGGVKTRWVPWRSISAARSTASTAPTTRARSAARPRRGASACSTAMSSIWRRGSISAPAVQVVHRLPPELEKVVTEQVAPPAAAIPPKPARRPAIRRC